MPEERAMNESTEYPQTSWVARTSHFLGVLSLILLLICGFIVFQAIRNADSGLQAWEPGPISISWLADVCAGVAGLAALAAIVLGILGLVDVRQGEGKVKGKSQAVSGLVTASLTLLTLTSVLVVAILSIPVIQRLESSNNLKVLGLAMQFYHEDHGHFPPAVLHDPALGERGQPYSWRVALLPYLGANDLYAQYRRDESWDSRANKAVLARMPRVFALPGRRPGAGLTHYQVLVGPGAAFERPDSRVRLTDFTQGASETILVVEASNPVPWTRPQDLPYAPDGPLPKVGGLGNGFHAMFADATVRWIEAEKRENELRTHVPRNGR
jgi:Protein of unknown function (DUF1559)